MAEPTLALSFEDLQIRVAEYLGVADYSGGAAAKPTDAHDLDRVQRIVNDGWRNFVSSNPKWEWLTPTFQLQFDPDGNTSRTVDDSTFTAPYQDDTVPRAARYFMPDGFYGVMLSYFTYANDGPLVKIDMVHEAVIRDNHAGAEAAGDPFLSAIRPLPASVGAFSPKWEAIFYPTPESDEIVTARCRVWPNQMVADSDRHAAGFQFDNVVLAACLAEAERQHEDQVGKMTQMYAQELQRAILLDRQSKPRFMGYNGDYSDRSLRPRKPYTGVDSYASASGNTYNF